MPVLAIGGQVNRIAVLFQRGLELLAERGLSVGVEVAVNQALDVPEWDELADELENTARSATLLPMSGTAPDWSNGTPADALRRAGLTYLDRADDQ